MYTTIDQYGTPKFIQMQSIQHYDIFALHPQQHREWRNFCWTTIRPLFFFICTFSHALSNISFSLLLQDGGSAAHTNHFRHHSEGVTAGLHGYHGWNVGSWRYLWMPVWSCSLYGPVDICCGRWRTSWCDLWIVLVELGRVTWALWSKSELLTSKLVKTRTFPDGGAVVLGVYMRNSEWN
jgi:hypothetical protein